MQDFIDWLAENGRMPSTIDTYTFSVQQFIDWHRSTSGKEFSPSNFESKDLQQYKYHLVHHARGRNGKLATATVNKKIESLRTYFNYLEETEQITKNPASKIKQQKAQRNCAPKWLDQDEKTLVINYVKDVRNWANNRWRFTRNRALVFTMLLGGLRVGEATALDIGDVDLKRRIINIYNGKGGKSRKVEFGNELHTYYSEWLEERNHKDVKSNKFFTSQISNLCVRGVTHIVRKVKEATNVNHLTPHTMRHTFAHDLLQKGCSITLVADLLGHESLETTRIYTLSSEDERRRALSTLETI